MHITMIDASHGKRVQQGCPSKERMPKANSVRVAKVEAQNNSSSSPPRSPRAARTKNDAQVAYRVCFGCCLYGWKNNFIELPMAPVPHQNSI
jgi:hypothetical protein